MLIPRFMISMFLIGLMVLAAGAVSGQNYPTKPIRLVTADPGGTGDLVARLIAQEISGPLGQQIVIDNRPSGVIPGHIVASAPPDGYTLLVLSSSLWIQPLTQKTISHDPLKDFSPISLTHRAPFILVAVPSLLVKSVKELIALAKVKPGQFNYASSGPASATHLAGELFKAMAGINIVHVAYKGTPPAIIALIGGGVPL